MKRRIVILGGGIAGYSAAKAIQETNEDVDLTVLSQESVPTYSACLFADYLAGEIRREQLFLDRTDRKTATPPGWVLGRRVERIDVGRRMLILEGEEPLGFDRLILATGSKPIVPKWSGVEKEGVARLKTIADADAAWRASGRDAVVVGAGPVGLEVAVALRKRGWNVAVVELLETILSRLFSPAQSQTLHALLERQGIRLLVRERLQSIEGGRRVEAVVTDKRTLDCQLALIGIGMRPEVELAREAGLEIGSQGGVVVDSYMRTNQEDVYACGDCVESVDRLSGRRGLSMLWGAAKTQGTVAGWNSLGLRRKHPGTLNITTLKLYDTTATSLGTVLLPDASHGERVRHRGDGSSIRLVVQDGFARGMQAVGPRVDTSIFLHLMLSGQRLQALQESRNRYSLIRQMPWLVRLPNDLRE